MAKYCSECGNKINEDNKTYICVVIDESGSMQNKTAETISGYNDYLKSLKEKNINGEITLIQFNSNKGSQTVYHGRRLSEAGKLNNKTYVPSGWTPLYDAVYDGILLLDKACSNKAIMVIITDGLENASIRHNQSEIRNMITPRQDKGWKFVYLGANQDAWAAGGSIGISSWTISDYRPDDTVHVYRAAASMTCCFAATGDIGESASDSVNSAVNKSHLF